MLVSAFDIHHKFVAKKYLKVPEILFVDSGGYEALYYDWLKVEKWERSMYKDILDKWDQYIPAIFASFDHDSFGLPIEKQIKREIEFLCKYRAHQMIEILLKPGKGERYLDVNQVIANIDDLNHFNIIGVTEKELGPTFLKRLEFVATLRGQLDRVENDAPIHIFGCLEPILMVLYFLAGAEIFDGLSWSRYAYIDGGTVYNIEYGVLELGIDTHFTKLKEEILRRNLSYLKDFSHNMRRFVDTGNYEEFGKSHMNKIKEIHETLYSEL
jgi:queuine/archaeosine tRNA-ribosyltransferase